MENSSHLKFGDIITIKLASDDFYFSSPGFVNTEITLKKIKQLDKDDISECLFRIIPAITFNTLKKCQFDFEEKNKFKLLDQIADELQEQQKLKNINKGVELQFDQNFLLEHVISKKILAIYQPQNNSEPSYCLRLDPVPMREFTFSFQQIFQYRNNKESFIIYDESAILSMNLQENRYAEFQYAITDAAHLELKHKMIIDNDDMFFQTENGNFTPLIIQKFEDQKDAEVTGSIKAGDILVINHLKSTFNLKNNSSVDNLYFESSQDMEKTLNSHWVIEKQSQQNGGFLKWTEPFRFKNLETGRYICFDETQINYKLPYYPVLNSYTIDNSTLFWLQDEKGCRDGMNTQNIDYTESFFIGKTLEDSQKVYMGVNFNIRSTLFEPILSNNAVLFESYTFMKISDLQQWEFRFIKDCQNTLSKAVYDVKQIFQKGDQGWNLNINSMTILQKIRKALSEIDIFLFRESVFTGQIFKCKSQNENRTNQLVSSNIHQYLFDLAKEIIQSPKNLSAIMSFLNQEDEPSPVIVYGKKSLVNDKPQQVNKNSQKISLMKKLSINKIYGQSMDIKKFGKKCLQIIEESFNLIALLLKSKNFPEEKILPYTYTAIENIFQGVDAWQFLTKLIKKINKIYFEFDQDQCIINMPGDLFSPHVKPSVLHYIFGAYINYLQIRSIFYNEPRMIEFLAVICIHNSKLNKLHQTLIGQVMFDPVFFQSKYFSKIFIQYLIKDNQLFIVYENDPIEIQQFSKNMRTLGTTYFTDVLTQQLRLFSLLCEKRNYSNIHELKKQLPYTLIMDLILSDLLNFEMRASFLDLYNYLYVDVYPQSHSHQWETKVQNKQHQVKYHSALIQDSDPSTLENLIKNFKETNDLFNYEYQQQPVDINFEEANTAGMAIMRSTIMKLFEDAYDQKEKYIVQPGYFCFFLSMVKCMRNYITLKQFDISDPNCDEDDKILSWSFSFLECLETSHQHVLDLRSKAAIQGLDQSEQKPYRKTLLQDFENYKSSDDLIQGLKVLIMEIFELKVMYLQDDMIDEFLQELSKEFKGIQAFEKYQRVKDYTEKTFIQFVRNGLTIEKKLRNGDEFSIQSVEFINKILYQFQKSSDFELDTKLLKVLFLISNRNTIFIKKIQNIQFIFQNDRKELFYLLKELVECIKHMQQNSQLWLKQENERHNHIIQLFKEQLKDIVGILQRADAAVTPDEDTLYNIQKNLQSLDFQNILFSYLEENMDNSHPANKVQEDLFKDIFQSIFKLLSLQVKNNPAMKRIMLLHIHSLKNFLKLHEFGQTTLIIDIFTNDLITQSSLDSSLICTFVKSLRARIHQKDVDPTLLGFFDQVMTFQGEIIESTMHKVIDNIFFTSNVYDFLGMSVQKSMEEKYQRQKLNQSKIQDPENIFIQDDFFYTFDLNFSEHEKKPYTYQIYALKYCRQILQKIPHKEELLNILGNFLNINYVFVLLTKQDFYSIQCTRNDEMFLNTVFKTELLNLAHQIWFDQDKQTPNLEKNGFIMDFVKQQTKVLKQMSRQIRQDIKLELIQIRKGKGLCSINQTDSYKYLMKFLKIFYPINTKLDIPLDEYEYSIYLIKNLLPFICDLKKNLILKSQTLYTNDTFQLNQMGWDVIDDFENAFINFFETKLSVDEKTLYEKIFHNILMDFKTIFQVQKEFMTQKLNQEDIILLSDYLIVEKVKEISLAQNLTELRNILSIKRENTERETYMSVFLQILTSPCISDQLGKNESLFLVDELKSNFSFDLQSPKGSIDTNSIIDNIVKYLKVGLKHMQGDLQVRSILFECLNLLCLFVESYEDDSNINMIQNYIFDSSLGRILMENLGNSSSYFEPLLICEQLRLISALLMKHSHHIQKQIYHHFSTDSKVEILIHYIHDVIEQEIDKIQLLKNEKLKSLVLLGELPFNHDKSDRHQIIHCFKFIKSLNSDHFQNFQIFFRRQLHCNNSYDILELIIKLFDRLIRRFVTGMDQNQIIVSDHHYDIMLISLQTILSMIQGECIENKTKILQSSLLDNFSDILKLNESTITTRSSKIIDKELKDMGWNVENEGYITPEQVLELKDMVFEIIEHLVENDTLGLNRKKIVRTLDFNVLVLNINSIYNNFFKKYNEEYQINNRKDLHYAFQIFFLLRDLDDTNNLLVEGFEHLQKNKKKKVNTMESLFYRAYIFLNRNSASIEIINRKGELQEIHFAFHPHFNALTEDKMEEIQDKIDRSNSQVKLNSLMELTKEFNESLYAEASFKEKASSNKITQSAIFLSQQQPFLRQITFLITIFNNIYIIDSYSKYSTKGLPRDQIYQPILIRNTILLIMLCIQWLICAVLLTFFVIQKKSYIQWQIEEKQKQKQIIRADSFGAIKAIQGLTQYQTRVLTRFEKASIFISCWFFNQAVAYASTYMPIIFLALFYHEFFVSLLLLDIFFIFPETQNVFKAFWEPRYKLLRSLSLFFICMYLFSILAYLSLREEYDGLCDNMFMCFSVIFDNAMKTRASKLFATLSNYTQNSDGSQKLYFIDWESIYDFFFTLFIDHFLWIWTFTSLIIESYGALRRASVAKFNDINNICIACTLNREAITKKCSHGFDRHVKNEHNQWNYLRYMASLYCGNNDQFTGTEKYVWNKMMSKDIHWFPINKCLKFSK